jgi:hypothetical protein
MPQHFNDFMLHAIKTYFFYNSVLAKRPCNLFGAANNEAEETLKRSTKQNLFEREVQWLLLLPNGDAAASCCWFLLDAKAALKSFFSCRI